MIDLNGRIPCSGLFAERGMKAVDALQRSGDACGVFKHNEIEITVYQNSTPRELMWQYEAKMWQYEAMLS